MEVKWQGEYVKGYVSSNELYECMNCMNCTNWVKGIKRLNQGRRVNNDICSERCLVSTPRRNLYVWLRVALVSFQRLFCFSYGEKQAGTRDGETGNCGLLHSDPFFDPRGGSGSAYRINSWRVVLHLTLTTGWKHVLFFCCFGRFLNTCNSVFRENCRNVNKENLLSITWISWF